MSLNQASRTLVIATAGHIDHGKTTLVRALTGIDTGRLPEEKRRGITIDLGFAPMALNAPDGPPIAISFVDVPGHALFVRNMLAGAGCVPAVLFVVAADEGIKPQTVEHLAICELLGIAHGIIAITKSDRVDHEQLQRVAANTHALVANTFLRTAPILPVSAHTAEGIAALRDELLKLAAASHGADSEALIRLPIDRAFAMKGFGTVVTGTLLSGAMREGQSVLLEPGARTLRIRGLQTHGTSEQVVTAGTRVAVNLSGIDVSDVHRGQALVQPETFSPVEILDAEIRLLPSTPALKHGARVHFHAFTSEVMANIYLYGHESAKPGTTRLARIKLDQRVVLAARDRFVLRQPAPVATIGGGQILDCHLQARERKATTLQWLEQMRMAETPEQLVLRVIRRGTAGITVRALAREAALTLERTHDHLQSAVQEEKIAVLQGDLLVTRDALAAAKRQVVTIFERLANKPATSNIKSSELRSQTSLPSEVFDRVIGDLADEGKLRSRGDDLFPPHETNLGPAESQTLAAIAHAYEAAGLAPPLVPELAQHFRLNGGEIRRLITLLQRQKTIVRMGSDDLFIHARALESLAGRMASLRGKQIDVAGFKQLTGLSRKYAIPLLEYLDHARITRKQGDLRMVL